MDTNEVKKFNIFDEIVENKKLREEGKFIGIPYYEIYKRFGEDFPVIEKGHQGMLTASSGAGKTHWWIEMLLFRVWLFITKLKKEGKEAGFIPIYKIALLENTQKEFEYRLLARILAHLSKQVFPAKMLKGRDKFLIPNEILEKYRDEATIILDEIMSWCTVVTSITNPTGLYKWARKQSELHGTHHWKEDTFNGEKVKLYDRYVPFNEKEHIIFIVDNANNITEEKGAETQHLAIRKWYRDYGRLQITKHWQWTLINIHQQASDTEKLEFNQGRSITAKLKPSAAGLGNNKEVQRDCHFIWGLFNPSKYEIENYCGYNIKLLKNYFRSLLILKQNDGNADVEYPFFFHGGASIMNELPKPDKIGDYNKILNYYK